MYIHIYVCVCVCVCVCVYATFSLFHVYTHFRLHWVSVAAWAFSGCGERGLTFVAVPWLLIVAASLVAELGL